MLSPLSRTTWGDSTPCYAPNPKHKDLRCSMPAGHGGRHTAKGSSW